MMIEAVPRFPGLWSRATSGSIGPVCVIVGLIMLGWYLACVPMNVNSVARAIPDPASLSFLDRLIVSANQPQPLLAAPHQIIREIITSSLNYSPFAKRSLIYHSAITLWTTLIGFSGGVLAGIALAISIVHARSLRRSLMPWIVISQTIPILAIAPMIVVTMGKLDLPLIFPKATIAAYLCFFPVTVSMVKGLSSPDVLQLDLMRTYHASGAQTFRKLRWPASTPYLFVGLKIALAASLVGAIVAEMPNGAQGGLGSRLINGFMFNNDLQVWSALFASALLASLLILVLALIERLVLRRMGVSK